MKHEILIDQDSVLDALFEFDFDECVMSPKFANCVIKAWNVSREDSLRNVLIATYLLDEFEAIETKEENGVWKMYGHDAEGDITWLLHRGPLSSFENLQSPE